MLDRNKTRLTHEVTAVVMQWFDERGFKPVETEVDFSNRGSGAWIADIGGMSIPTQTELQMLKMIGSKPKWDGGADGSKWMAFQKRVSELTVLTTMLVEVKTSRGDFRQDKKWKRIQPTNLAYIAYPKGILFTNEWPAGWGILEYDEKSKIIKQLQVPTRFDRSTEEMLRLVYDIAIRRENATRNARWKEMRQQLDVETIPVEQLYRFDRCLRAAISIAEGKYDTHGTCLSYHGIRLKNIPEDLEERMAVLHQKAKAARA